MTASFTIIYVYSVEIFPTPIRNVGIGGASMFSRISGMMAPFVGGPLVSNYFPQIPINCLMCFCSVIVVEFIWV